MWISGLKSYIGIDIHYIDEDLGMHEILFCTYWANLQILQILSFRFHQEYGRLKKGYLLVEEQGGTLFSRSIYLSIYPNLGRQERFFSL